MTDSEREVSQREKTVGVEHESGCRLTGAAGAMAEAHPPKGLSTAAHAGMKQELCHRGDQRVGHQRGTLIPAGEPDAVGENNPTGQVAIWPVSERTSDVGPVSGVHASTEVRLGDD